MRKLLPLTDCLIALLLPSIAAFMSATFVGRWRDIWVDSLQAALASSDKDSLLTGISKAVRLLIQIALLGLGALLVLDFHASGGIMIASSIIGARALAPIDSGVASYKSFIAARLAWMRLEEILNNAPRRDEGMALPAPEGKLSAQRIGFINPQTRKTILSNVAFDLLAGESLGVIGPSARPAVGSEVLVSCVVAPGFDFADFTLLADVTQPGG